MVRAVGLAVHVLAVPEEGVVLGVSEGGGIRCQVPVRYHRSFGVAPLINSSSLRNPPAELGSIFPHPLSYDFRGPANPLALSPRVYVLYCTHLGSCSVPNPLSCEVGSESSLDIVRVDVILKRDRSTAENLEIDSVTWVKGEGGRVSTADS